MRLYYRSFPDSPFLEIRDSPVSGLGVFARSAIHAGELLAVCGGIVYSTADCPSEGHAMQVGEDLWLWSDGGNLDDFINHSCGPNSGFVNGKPELFALKDIAPGEEIVWDYSTSLVEEGWSLQCRCGSKSCRGKILPFFSLSPEDRRRLLPVSLDFIRRMFEKRLAEDVE
ncbi:MAG: SET domain-containing protein-lysine N-methyltransferase [Spirochaetales bacterium]|nr:SET domain-containing protein-lysine N-methyltransferase [Spirochaetales bacterium]